VAIKRGLALPDAMERLLSLVHGSSVTALARDLKTNVREVSKLIERLRARGLVCSKTVHAGRGRPTGRISLTPRGARILELLRGGEMGHELSEDDLRAILKLALEHCKSCRATEFQNRGCALVSAYAHMLGLDWERGVPICSCSRWPSVRRSWAELVEG